ncbi:MAG: poly-gamma-glutamate biosynthesis protein PgsC/CapC [Chloroflexota bacterium]
MINTYLFDTELIRLSIVLGVVISLYVYKRYGLTSGGVIVPGYLALFVLQPTYIVATLGLSTATYFVVHKQLRPRFMLWGRKLFESEIVVALTFQIIWVGILALITPSVPAISLLYGVGFLLPGIIAHDMGRQGVSKTLAVTLGCAITVFGLITIIGGMRDLFGLSPALTSDQIAQAASGFAYPVRYLMVGICVSVIATILLYRGPFMGSLRTGGFVTAAYLALFLNRPLDLLAIVIGSVITYLVVSKILMQQAILFGRSKVAAMVLVGMITTWLIEFILNLAVGYTPWYGFNAIAPMIVALLANDAQRQGPKRTLIGGAIATIIVFLTLVWV